MIRIRDWAKLYELPRREKEGDGPLEYVRWKCYAHKVTVGFADLADACPDGYMAALGLFGKLLEFAGVQPRPLRDGVVRDNRGGDASPHWISRRLLGVPVEELAKWLSALAIAAWIDLDAAGAREIEELSGRKSGSLPVTLGDAVAPHEPQPAAADDGDSTAGDAAGRDSTPLDGTRRDPTGHDGTRRDSTGLVEARGFLQERKPKPKTELELKPKPKGATGPVDAPASNGHPRDGPSASDSVFARSGFSASDFGAKAMALGQLKLGEIERFRRVLADTSRQGDSDRTSRDLMLRTLAKGCRSEGEMVERLDGLLAKARQIGRSRTARSVMAELTAWFKRTHGGWT